MEVGFLVSGSPEPRTGRGRRPSPPAQVHLGCPPCYLKEAPTLYHSGQSPLFSQTFPQSRLTIALSCSIAFYGSPRPPGSSPRDPPSPPPADLTPDYSYFLLWEGLGLHDTQFEIPFLGPFSWRTPIHPTEPARLTCTLQCPPCLAPDINRPLLHSPGFPPLCKLPEDRNLLVLAMACLISWTLGSWRTCLSGPCPQGLAREAPQGCLPHTALKGSARDLRAGLCLPGLTRRAVASTTPGHSQPAQVPEVSPEVALPPRPTSGLLQPWTAPCPPEALGALSRRLWGTLGNVAQPCGGRIICSGGLKAGG